MSGKREGPTCRQKQEEHGDGPFYCPNHGLGPRDCNGRTFLYPRKRTNGKFHTHQGIDFYPDESQEEKDKPKRPVPILAVTGGRVCYLAKWDGTKAGYGNVVGIYNLDLDMTFWYAHCETIFVRKDDVLPVLEGQEIATVGSTGWAGKRHLHFEVHRGRSVDPPGIERTIFNAVGPRLDPREVLLGLGPWGTREVFFPTGKKAVPQVVADLHLQVEGSRQGGYFPLGANNLWHGGVHLPRPPAADLHAPFRGEIVALRLDPNPATAITPLGSTNFILLRHEIGESVYARLQSESGAPPEEPKPKPKPKAAAVGPGASNTPADVLAVKQALREKGLAITDPTDPTPDDELFAAIVSYQSTLASPYEPDPERPSPRAKKWPDGVITVGGYTWKELFPTGRPIVDPQEDPKKPSTPTRPPLDPKRTIYSLFMHVAAVPITAALVKRVPWLAKAKLPDSTPPTPEEEAKAAAEHAADVAEGARALSGHVGRKEGDHKAPGKPADIEWVQRRLVRHGMYAFDPATQAGVFDDALDLAIRSFQETYVAYFASHDRPGSGRVLKGKKTYKALAAPANELRAPGKKAKVDPAFRDRLVARGDDGMTRVISGLSIPVGGNEVLWLAGQAPVAQGEGSMESLVHWEIFSESQVVGAWEGAALRDTNDDLTLDVPERIFEAVELTELPGFERNSMLTPLELAGFYASERSMFLRRTPCLFRSEWGMDLATAIPRIGKMAIATAGLGKLLTPMMWWDHAADVLPPSPVVWHYNPIEFIGLYQSHLDALTPKPVDSKTQGTLQVRVLYENEVPRPNAGVILGRGVEKIQASRSSPTGEAWFPGLEPGEYTVWVDQSMRTFHAVTVPVGDPVVVEVITTVVGPPPSLGTIMAQFRRHGGSRALAGTMVQLRAMSGGEVLEQPTVKGDVQFEGLRYGKYTMTCLDMKPMEVELDRKVRKLGVIVLRPQPCTLWVKVVVDGVGAPDLTVRIVDRQHDDVLITGPQITDEMGMARFEVRAGRYRATVGDHSIKVVALETGSPLAKILLNSKDEPKPEEKLGTLTVTVVTATNCVPGREELVVVSNVWGFVDSDIVDDLGMVSFQLPPDHYQVKVGDQPQKDVDVLEDTMTSVELVVPDEDE